MADDIECAQPTHPKRTEGGEELLLETMVGGPSTIDVDDLGHWNYHGHTSRISLARSLPQQLGASAVSFGFQSTSALGSKCWTALCRPSRLRIQPFHQPMTYPRVPLDCRFAGVHWMTVVP